jgi:hypothetical protein
VGQPPTLQGGELTKVYGSDERRKAGACSRNAHEILTAKVLESVRGSVFYLWNTNRFPGDET